MTLCPYCNHDNIEGVDVCEECGQSLDDLHLPEPATIVEKRLLTDRLNQLPAHDPVTVAPDARVGDVLNLMVERGIGCVLVCEDDQLVGVFSERDALMRLNIEASQLADSPVSQFMSTNPETLQADAKIAFAVHRMDLGSYRHVPVVDGQRRPIGVVSVRDILRYLTDSMNAATP